MRRLLRPSRNPYGAIACFALTLACALVYRSPIRLGRISSADPGKVVEQLIGVGLIVVAAVTAVVLLTYRRPVWRVRFHEDALEQLMHEPGARWAERVLFADAALAVAGGADTEALAYDWNGNACTLRVPAPDGSRLRCTIKLHPERLIVEIRTLLDTVPPEEQHVPMADDNDEQRARVNADS
jgi:hypothetical protein